MARTWWAGQPKGRLAAVLAVLVAVDALFVAVHVIADERRGSWTSLYTDTGPAGLYGFAQALAAALLVYVAYRRVRQSVYLAWAVTFMVVALDDIAQIHEIAGQGLHNRLELPAVLGLRGEDIGELLVWAMLGAPLLVILAVTVRDADPRARRDSVVFFVVMSALVVFGAAADALHMATVEDYEAVSLLGVVEDGGKLLGLTMLVGAAMVGERAPRSSADATAGGVPPALGDAAVAVSRPVGPGGSAPPLRRATPR